MEFLNNENIHNAVNLQFNNKDAINKYWKINNWDVFNVINIKDLFRNKINFNYCINN